MENKNKAVSEKIREYADMMFGRMAKYQNEVAEIVTEVNEMQLKQKKALEKLCSEAAEKLDMLTAAIRKVEGLSESETKLFRSGLVNGDREQVQSQSTQVKTEIEHHASLEEHGLVSDDQWSM